MLCHFSARRISLNSPIRAPSASAGSALSSRAKGFSTAQIAAMWPNQSPTKRFHESVPNSTVSPRCKEAKTEDDHELAESIRQLGTDLYRGLREIAWAMADMPVARNGPSTSTGFMFNRGKQNPYRFGRGGKR